MPCVSNDLTIALIGVGRRAHGEPLSSEDMSLLAAVAGQAATAIENARLYSQLQDKANEIEIVRQFNTNVVESLTDALVVVDPEDRVLHVEPPRRVARRRGPRRGRRAADLVALPSLVLRHRSSRRGATIRAARRCFACSLRRPPAISASCS